MKMICDVPDEVIKSVRMCTWCGSSVLEKMIANGTPLEQIRDAIEREADYQDAYIDADVAKGLYMALEIIDKQMK